MSENLMPHIRLPKDLDVDCVLLPGDPVRADTVASHLEDARLLASNREFRSWQGTYKGKKMLVTSTGIGADRKSTRLNSSHIEESRMPSSA